MSKSVVVSIALAALCWGAHAGSLQYHVAELPAVPLSDDGLNLVSGEALDQKGRALISMTDDGIPLMNGELCHKGKCRRVKPRTKSAVWRAFNGSDELAGVVYDDDSHPRPARRNRDGTVQILGSSSGYAWGINSAGVAVGADGVDAFYFDTQKHVLPTLGGQEGVAFAISDDGLIVGVSTLPNAERRAVVFHPNGEVTNLGLLPGGTRSAAYAINSKGVVVGTSNKAGQLDVVPVKFEGGAVIELGSLGGTWGVAQGINKAGTVVGVSTDYPNQDSRAFVYRDHKMTDLNDAISADARSRWLLFSAVAINDAGQILVEAYRWSPWSRAVLLLTPKP